MRNALQPCRESPIIDRARADHLSSRSLAGVRFLDTEGSERGYGWSVGRGAAFLALLCTDSIATQRIRRPLTPESFAIVPFEKLTHGRFHWIDRLADAGIVESVVVAAILKVVANSSAHSELEIRLHRDVPQVKQAMQV